MGYIIEKHLRALIGTKQLETHVVQAQTIYMAGIKAIGRRRTGPAGLRIVGALLAVGFVYNLAPAAVLNADIAERHVLDGVSLHAGDDDACQRIAVVGYHITYIYVAC